METVLLIGIPASGKSTFCGLRLAATHVRVNFNTLKRRPRELRFVRDCIANGRDFVVDNTCVLRAKPKLLSHGHQHVNRETLIGETRIVDVYGHGLIQV